ncbi:hypothetical protein ABZ379_49535 [Streptomyces canus]|uniref:hypothetical protein n=1 Tax=Streptomyces canus TaxID=58343 RepID=UPI0033F70E43
MGPDRSLCGDLGGVHDCAALQQSSGGQSPVDQQPRVGGQCGRIDSPGSGGKVGEPLLTASIAVDRSRCALKLGSVPAAARMNGQPEYP